MGKSSAYLLSEVDRAGQEVKRLSAQAQLFIDLELAFLLAEISPQARVADFGCGSGAIVAALARARPLADLWALDADPLAVEQSRQSGGRYSNLSFERYALGLGQAAPVGALNIAFTRLVLLHVPDPVQALKDMAATLAPWGKLYVVESDDRHMLFAPVQPWQARALELFEAVQAQRGGSRQRGASMDDLLLAAGLKPQPVATVHYCKSRIGPQAFAELFTPVAAFYLAEAARTGLAMAVETEALLGQIEEFLINPDTEVDMSLFHWVGTLAKTNR